jgi:hypothetical protein
VGNLTPYRIFLLSPANCGGARARMVMSERATFPLAARLRSGEGAPLGEVFSFMSGLYFRGKLAYARAFASPPDCESPTWPGVFVITPTAGLRPADTPVTIDALRTFAGENVAVDNPRYRRPLESSAKAIAADLGDCDVVLLGSIASPKYVEVLLDIFGDRLKFPADFVGRGDMSRGGLLLRCVSAAQELDYIPVAGSVRRGQRPPRLVPIKRSPAVSPPAPSETLPPGRSTRNRRLGSGGARPR